MSIQQIQAQLKQYGRYKFNLNYKHEQYEINIVMFTKDKEIILFEAIESIKKINNGVPENLEINEFIVTPKFLKEITKLTGCFKTKEQHRPPQRVIKKWLITDISNKNKKNDILVYKDGKLELTSKNRAKLFVSKNRFNLFFNNAYFYFEDGFFKIIEDYIDIIEVQSKLRHIEIDKMYLFIVYCLSDDCIIKYLEMLLEKTYKWLENNNLKLIDIYRLDYIEYEKNLILMAKNFLYHIMKIDIEKIRPRPVSFTENIMPLTKNFSVVIEVNSEKFLFIPFNPKDGVLISFKDNTILDNDFDFLLPIQNEQEILNQIIFDKIFLKDNTIVIPSDTKYLEFSKKYVDNFIFELDQSLEIFVINQFGKEFKMDSSNFRVNEKVNLVELQHKNFCFPIYLYKDNLIYFNNNHHNDINSMFSFVNYLDGFDINNFCFFVKYRSKIYHVFINQII